MFEFTAEDFPVLMGADAIRTVAAANARLNALRRAFPKHADSSLVDHAVASWNEAPTPEQSVALYKTRFTRMSENRQRKYLKSVRDTQRAAQLYA